MWHYGANLKKNRKRIAGAISLFLTILVVAKFAFSSSPNEPNPHSPNGPFYFVDFRDASVPSTGTRPESLLFVSYNIEYGRKLNEIITDLQHENFAGADFIELQEATGEPGGQNTDAADIARALKMEAVFAPASVRYGRDYGNAILSRWDLSHFRKALMPHSEVGNQRIALGADARVGDVRISVYSAHLSVGYPDSFFLEPSRAEQVAVIANDIRKHRVMRVVVSGDFNNANPIGWRHARKMLTDEGLTEVPNPWTSFKTFGTTLDHAFMRQMDWLEPLPGHFATGSDHYPIRWRARFRP